jgi:hypothetical protein
MVMIAMPLSLVSCTRSVMENPLSRIFKLYIAFAEALDESITMEAMRSR